ncbi:uncharacterized protein TRAVEDRAFT_71603 [Trametes versicolor FP-101664 SS1]|uniref:uncharacterized protein n=1 Tax=Trametes versicolor (strain FP-101664) TaxID=717944 RepID=UPI000462420B|nr:uncharacterized protein TRAVEDRAFT_71603 [Trametes versicolor FP-101664 SS1]EIW59588.1 hypothetical protein TRAVEDRAFT_71603 [Trametes versicolor FP-101664 SS1]
MPDTDEYDAFYSPIDHQDLVDIEVAAISAHTLRETTPSTPTPQSSQESQLEQSLPDEFDSYDFSEFTAEDFEHIDALVREHTPDISPPPVTPVQAQQPREPRRSNSRGSGRAGRNGGPRVEIGIEEPNSANTRRLFKGSSRRAPFQEFRKWNGGILSVTDLVGPSWCEVQFDYGLRQKRYKKLEDRPTSFVTAEGKTISVVQNVAAQNDRTVSRGKSVHKVLEREVQPDVVAVQVTTPEERWGLRLVNMLSSLHTLMTHGYCREMPVFGVVQDQVVTGIIDEIARKPMPLTTQETHNQGVGTSSPNKRGPPSTPSKHATKRSKHDAVQDQAQITNFFSPGKRASIPPPATEPTEYSLHLSDTKTRTRPALPPDEDTLASRVQLMLYHRLLSNLLAPSAPFVQAPTPLDFAALWTRVGVDPARRFSDGFLTQAGLAPEAVTQDTPTEATDTATQSSADSLSCLNDLTVAWAHAVEALNVVTVHNTLTLVYRSQPTRKRSKDKERAKPAPSGTELSSQEAQDLAAAIQASVNDVQGVAGTDGDDDLARAILESLKDSVRSGAATEGDLGVLTHPFGLPISEVPGMTTLEGEAQVAAVPDALEDDPELAWAIQQSLLPRIENVAALQEAAVGPDASAVAAGDSTEAVGEKNRSAQGRVSENVGGGTKTAPASPARSDDLVEANETMTVAELDVEARIIGTKAFELDDTLLDGYLARVLAWWYGRRAPEGVSVELTRRCMTCEYREGCEWREKKAQEAAERYRASNSQSGR